MARKKKIKDDEFEVASAEQVAETLDDVQEAMESEPSAALKSHSKKNGSIKSKYEDHPKFQKFKKEGN